MVITTLEDIESVYHLPETPDLIHLKEGQRLIGIGDIHGNFQLLVGCLRAGNLVDEELGWCGGNTICVQVGDLLDRGKEELECVKLLCRLARQAQMDQGAVIMLWGNHEIENACGSFISTADKESSFRREFGPYLDATRGRDWRNMYATQFPDRWAVMQPGGVLSKPLLSKLKIAAQVGRSVFVHAGITEQQLSADGGIVGLNRRARDWITNSLSGAIQASNDGERIEVIMEVLPQFLQAFPASLSPCWMRDFSSPPNKEPIARSAMASLESAFDLLDGGVDRIVVGHTIQKRINPAMGGRVWRIDIGKGVNVAGKLHSQVIEIIRRADRDEEKVEVRKHPLLEESTRS